MATGLINKCVEDRAAQAVVFATDEHPVFVPDLVGADGIIDEPVVELNLAQ